MKNVLLLALLLFGFQAIGQLADNMYPDSLHGRFIYGVASGDPTDTTVIIWSCLDVDNTSQTESGIWQISNHENFCQITHSGNFDTDYSKYFTIKIDVSGLNPNTIYYYRFIDSQGDTSIYGRTRTAPRENDSLVEHIRFGITSCSSIYSGYFNGYKHLSERRDLDFVLNVGDYIYDFVDADEEVRVPSPYPTTPYAKNEWRDRHLYYLMDPDLREARRWHPWFIIWDNHDINSLTDPYLDLKASMEAFWEFIPCRMPNPTDPTRIYRSYSYGKLLDLKIIDMYSKRDQYTLAQNEWSLLGAWQDQWIFTELASSDAKWKFVPQQKIIAGWSMAGVPAWLGGGGQFLDTKNWDGYDYARDYLLGFIEQQNIDNVMFLTGDSHITLVADCSTDPYDSGTYNGSNGNGSIATEFLPTSITRGNFDEMLGGTSLVPLAESYMLTANPNHVHTELTEHGYGIINVTPDTVIAELWYNEILNQSNTETFSGGYFVQDGINHWDRSVLTSPTQVKDITNLVDTSGCWFVSVPEPNYNFNETAMNIYPNPFEESIHVEIHLKAGVFVEIYDGVTGRIIKRISCTENKKVTIPTNDLSTGNYLFVLKNNLGHVISQEKAIKN
ncbi:MAG: alkaline phosphatase D family protein [Flavobacteriales bacterium]|nr:alkaline phosphatase D family protein [Flavobacteriales bacterium]MCB9196206.1 alkaline phosphatase D family protein [Flavobacteriales bacterium]